jgi:membrane protease subunit HflK
MQQIMASTTKIVIDKGGSNLLYLPLDKIMQMGRRCGNAGLRRNGGRCHPPPADPSTSRSREAFRSREREQRQ